MVFLRGSRLTGHFAVNCVDAAVSDVMEILPTVLLFAIFGFGIVVLQCIAAKPLGVGMDCLDDRAVDEAWMVSAPLGLQVRVINEGFPGENTAELDARLDGVLDQSKPEYVVLFVGANDALNEKEISHYYRDGKTSGRDGSSYQEAWRRGHHGLPFTILIFLV